MSKKAQNRHFLRMSILDTFKNENNITITNENLIPIIWKTYKTDRSTGPKTNEPFVILSIL